MPIITLPNSGNRTAPAHHRIESQNEVKTSFLVVNLLPGIRAASTVPRGDAAEIVDGK
jgi:hypothetical protein